MGGGGRIVSSNTNDLSTIPSNLSNVGLCEYEWTIILNECRSEGTNILGL